MAHVKVSEFCSVQDIHLVKYHPPFLIFLFVLFHFLNNLQELKILIIPSVVKGLDLASSLQAQLMQ